MNQPSPSWEGAELPSIGYLLESIDSELCEFQATLLDAAALCTKKGYLMLSATLEELAGNTIQQRLKMISWGASFGLVGLNGDQVVDDVIADMHRLPHLYHPAITELADAARASFKESRKR